MKCDECNKKNGHEIWCCLSQESTPAPVSSREWFGLNEDGRQVQRDTFPPHVNADFVLSYMQQRPMFGQIVVRVEVA
jgi:hypothetical protein